MEDAYFCSDGSLMCIEDFRQYLKYLQLKEPKFVFEEWFDEEDFLSKELFQKVKKDLLIMLIYKII